MTPHVPIDAERPEPLGRAAPSLFADNGAFVRHPAGGSGGKGPVEDCAGMAAAGFEWLVLNVGDHPPDSWAIWRAEAERADLACGPWARCHDIRDAERLAAVAYEWYAPLAVWNVEQEAGEPRWRMGGGSLAYVINGSAPPAVAVSTEPWLPDNFAWHELDQLGIACLPQAFWNDDARWTPSVVTTRARSYFTRVYPTLGVYPVAARPITPQTLASFYESSVGAGRPFSVYCSDDVPAWEPWTW